jgi:hypothetical protein
LLCFDLQAASLCLMWVIDTIRIGTATETKVLVWINYAINRVRPGQFHELAAPS